MIPFPNSLVTCCLISCKNEHEVKDKYLTRTRSSCIFASNLLSNGQSFNLNTPKETAKADALRQLRQLNFCLTLNGRIVNSHYRRQAFCCCKRKKKLTKLCTINQAAFAALWSASSDVLLKDLRRSLTPAL